MGDGKKNKEEKKAKKNKEKLAKKQGKNKSNCQKG
jgi:hypothetical protein